MKKLLYILLITLLFFGCEQASVMVSESVQDDNPTIVETRFTINSQMGTTTPITMEYPVIVHGETEYNLEDMAHNVFGLPVYISIIDGIRWVVVDMSLSEYSLNAVSGFDLSDLTVSEFAEVLTLIIEPPPVVDYENPFFSIMGTVGNTADIFEIGTEKVRINGVIYDYEFFPYSLDPMTIYISITIEQADSWFWYSDNLIKYFNLDYHHLTLNEVFQLIDMLERHPAENWVELKDWYENN